MGSDNQEMTLRGEKKIKEEVDDSKTDFSLFSCVVIYSGQWIGVSRKGENVKDRLYVEAVAWGSVG